MVTDTAGNPSRDIARKLDALGWGAFFVWIGVVLWADVGAGWTLTVIGLILLGVQLARAALGLKLEVFSAIVGGCFLLGGAGQILNAQIHLVPVLLILAGLAVILTSLWPGRFRRKHA